jgi:glycerol-3-phosphate acyltransferase PlsY
MLLVIAFFILSLFFSGGNACIIVWAFILMIMCVARHHANIGRLIRGTENRLGKKAG